MNRLPSSTTCALLLLGAVFCPPAAQSGEAPAGLEIRFHPSRGAYPYELDPARGLQSLVVQNTALVVPSVAGATDLWQIDEVIFELLANGEPVEARRLGRARLDASAQRAAKVAAGGLLDLLDFQFQPKVLLAGASLSPSATLPFGGALLLGHQVFAYAGPRDTLRVRARGLRESGPTGARTTVPFEAVATLPVLTAPTTPFAFPLAGSWFVGAGASFHHHHRWVVGEEFALDIARLQGDSTHQGDGSQLTDYYAYGAPVLAPGDGLVVAVKNDVPESVDLLRQAGETIEAYFQRLQVGQMTLLARGGALLAAGNYVQIRHQGELHSVLAHLQAGSVPVKVGEAVKKGQRIGRIGMSGSTTEPHLHVHFVEGADPVASPGVPVRYEGYDLLFDPPRALQSGDLVTATVKP
jgi:murein DD-endopeptidase MepM/ murein hydrolase activator NlpD